MSSPAFSFLKMKGEFTVHRFSTQTPVDPIVLTQPFYAVCRTEDELSIVCPSHIDLTSDKKEEGWSCLKLLGPLDFALTGVLADISTLLAKAGISIFALSTYDTDYFLIKSKKLHQAREALCNAGHRFN